MTVKLVGSTSGSVSLQAPASTTGGAHKTLTLPDINSTVDTTGRAGNILQVKTVTKTDHFTSTSAAWVDITGLSLDMTLSASSNKILMRYDVIVGGDWWNMGPVFLSFADGSTLIGRSTNGSSDTNNAASFATLYSDGVGNSSFNVSSQTATFLYSPGDTNSHTYKVRGNGQNTSGFSINRSWGTVNYSGQSTFTLIEISA
tara:strand:+ start:597 stop:1199 length:603 start_codon:yes stop_codon:yes gene_type:complete